MDRVVGGGGDVLIALVPYICNVAMKKNFAQWKTDCLQNRFRAKTQDRPPPVLRLGSGIPCAIFGPFQIPLRLRSSHSVGLPLQTPLGESWGDPQKRASLGPSGTALRLCQDALRVTDGPPRESLVSGVSGPDGSWRSWPCAMGGEGRGGEGKGLDGMTQTLAGLSQGSGRVLEGSWI